ncbi:hypothetical protein [Sphingomonas sp. 28-62-11]|uniref:hypothetical protein n=1 Tax=Sphingomonas sp. 28-62-11 TaxID=1970432 RepID=UPI000BD6FBB5|nr:MAG: hypothetical protein B7Y49_13155 [Sphingomonas sp. 28-62-11]
MTAIERWKSEQAELLAASLALRDLVANAALPQPDRLVPTRWRVARALLRYLPSTDRIIYARLRLHADAAARATANRFAAEAEAIYQAFEKHLGRWTPEAAAADWAAYRTHVRMQAMMVEDRLRRENAELLPFLASAPELEPVRAPGDRNWAGDGWRFRDLLGVDQIATERA